MLIRTRNPYPYNSFAHTAPAFCYIRHLCRPLSDSTDSEHTITAYCFIRSSSATHEPRLTPQQWSPAWSPWLFVTLTAGYVASIPVQSLLPTSLHPVAQSQCNSTIHFLPIKYARSFLVYARSPSTTPFTLTSVLTNYIET